jgi:hypothetical protein
MDASGSKGEGSDDKRIVDADLDSYEEMFREFMKSDRSKNFLRKWDGSYDKLMAYPGRYCEIFREILHMHYEVEVSLVLLVKKFTFVKLTHTHSTPFVC